MEAIGNKKSKLHSKLDPWKIMDMHFGKLGAELRIVPIAQLQDVVALHKKQGATPTFVNAQDVYFKKKADVWERSKRRAVS